MSLLTLSYWFGIHPSPFLPLVSRALLIAFAVWTVAGIAASLVRLKPGLEKTTRRILAKAATLFTWSGLTGLVLWAFEYERIPVLSMRIFYVVVLVWIVWGLWSIARYLRVELPAMRRMQSERAAAERWLPHSKR